MLDIYAEVTNRIIAELESGYIPWEKPWTGVSSGAISRATGKPYSLLNQMLLGEPGEYVTFKQAIVEGGSVRKGSKAKIVVFWKMLRPEKKDASGQTVRAADGTPIHELIPVLKYYSVFHISECDGLEPKYTKTEDLSVTASPVERADDIISDYVKRSNLTLVHEKQDSAYYSPRRHKVVLPLIEQFPRTEEYYSTAFHELTHSTGHKTLLNRFGDETQVAAFGSESYSKEELVAEIGASGILHELGMETVASFRNNVAYIQSWIKALKNDKKLIISASSRAEKAIKLILDMPITAEE